MRIAGEVTVLVGGRAAAEHRDVRPRRHDLGSRLEHSADEIRATIAEFIARCAPHLRALEDQASGYGASIAPAEA